MTRYRYHSGLASLQAAHDALNEAISDSEISEAERPQIEAYHITRADGRKVKRWMITLEGGAA